MYKLSKKLFFDLMFCMGVFLYNVDAQCATLSSPSLTTHTAYRGQCSNQYAQYCKTDSNSNFSSGIIKFPFNYVVFQKTFIDTTVGTTEYRSHDAFLYLNDSKSTTDTSDDVLLSTNDDDLDCDSLQSSITYINSAYSPTLINLYVIVTKSTNSVGLVNPSCEANNFIVKIKYNTMVADFDKMLPITNPESLSCLGSVSTIRFSNKTKSCGSETDSWRSYDSDSIRIDSSTGLVTILANPEGKSIRLQQYKKGILQSCNATKSEFITFPVTTAITSTN